MCHEDRSHWVENLFPVLLGPRNGLKEDLNARFVGRHLFLQRIRENMRGPQQESISHRLSRIIFAHKDLYSRSHVLVRADSVKKLLMQPYTGSHRNVERVSLLTHTIDVNGKISNIFIERLKLVLDGANRQDIGGFNGPEITSDIIDHSVEHLSDVKATSI